MFFFISSAVNLVLLSGSVFGNEVQPHITPYDIFMVGKEESETEPIVDFEGFPFIADFFLEVDPGRVTKLKAKLFNTNTLALGVACIAGEEVPAASIDSPRIIEYNNRFGSSSTTYPVHAGAQIYATKVRLTDSAFDLKDPDYADFCLRLYYDEMYHYYSGEPALELVNFVDTRVRVTQIVKGSFSSFVGLDVSVSDEEILKEVALEKSRDALINAFLCDDSDGTVEEGFEYDSGTDFRVCVEVVKSEYMIEGFQYVKCEIDNVARYLIKSAEPDAVTRIEGPTDGKISFKSVVTSDYIMGSSTKLSCSGKVTVFSNNRDLQESSESAAKDEANFAVGVRLKGHDTYVNKAEGVYSLGLPLAIASLWVVGALFF